MIKADDIRKINPKEYKFLSVDKSGNVWAWSKEPALSGLRNWWIPTGGKFFEVGRIEVEEFKGKSWKECLIEFEPDYSGALGCVGWFWDINENNKVLGILTKVSSGEAGAVYECDGRGNYCYFHHAKPNELKFYGE